MLGLTESLTEWSGRLRGENRTKAIQLLQALAEAIETAERERRYGGIFDHGVTFQVENGVLGPHKLMLNHSVK